MSSSLEPNCRCGLPVVVSPGYSHSRCNACGEFQFPTSIEDSEDAIVPQGKATPFSCPRCNIDLEVGRIGATEVCFCITCRGFVIDSVSLGGLIASRRAMWEGPDDEPVPTNLAEMDVHGICPACHEQLEAHHYNGPGNIVIDTCMQCKLAWLDHGELSKITRAPGKR